MKKIVLLFALAVVSSVVYAESVPAPVETGAKTEGARTGVRAPVGDVNQFWDNIAWSDMSPEEQELWDQLSDGASWDKLSKKERAAATALGFNRKAWNSVPAGSTK